MATSLTHNFAGTTLWLDMTRNRVRCGQLYEARRHGNECATTHVPRLSTKSFCASTALAMPMVSVK
jgi:hypothetical protein